MPTLYCHKCGYNLTGLRENRCPECGSNHGCDQLQKDVVKAEEIDRTIFKSLLIFPILFALISFCPGSMAISAVIEFTDDWAFWVGVFLLLLMLPFVYGWTMGRDYIWAQRVLSKDSGNWQSWPFWACPALCAMLEIVLTTVYLIVCYLILQMPSMFM